MKIFNEDTNQTLSNITILLKENEIIQLMGYLEELLSNATKDAHYHLNNDDFSKEITIALYDRDGKLDHFAEKYRKAILLDE